MSWKDLSKYRSELMGLACLWVMLHHNRFNWPDMLAPLERFAKFGSLGVDMFLLLSGVGLSCAWERKPRLGAFYARRFVRLLVPYALIAVPYWLWRDLWLGEGNLLLDLTQLSLPLQGVLSTWYVPAMAVMYLCFPLVARFLCNGDRWTRCVVLCGAVMLPCVYLNYAGSAIYDNCEIALTRFPIFFIGCALGADVRSGMAIAPHQPLLGLLWILLNSSLRRHTALGDVWIRFSHIPLCLSVCLVLLWLLERLKAFRCIGRLLRFFGERSLELYLTHILLRNVFYHYVPVDQWDPWGIVTYALILCCSAAASTILHPLITRLRGVHPLGKEAP